MIHVKQIEDMVDRGEHGEAFDALDQLLTLGPQNTTALKLKARLYAFEGRFEEEARVWDRIATIDREDEDAINYYYQRQIEDREHFYFTDDLPGGGRRYIAQPRAFITLFLLCSMACILFVYFAVSLSQTFPILRDPEVLPILFLFMVMTPFSVVLIYYLRSLKAVSVNDETIEVATRLRLHTFRWQEIDNIYMASSQDHGKHKLSLVLIPSDTAKSRVEIDMREDSTAIRARSYLLRDVRRLYGPPIYTRHGNLPKDGKTSSY